MSAKDSASGKTAGGFTEEERAAMKERAQELKKERGGKAAAKGLEDILEKLAEMPDDDRVMAERLHSLITEAAPDLVPKTWYGMPAYARDGKLVVFFQAASKFKVRYATLGFNEDARLDDGNMWPTAYALTKLTAADEKKITALVKRAAG